MLREMPEQFKPQFLSLDIIHPNFNIKSQLFFFKAWAREFQGKIRFFEEYRKRVFKHSRLSMYYEIYGEVLETTLQDYVPDIVRECDYNRIERVRTSMLRK